MAARRGMAAMPARMRSIGRARPMTPVEATTTSAASHPIRSATPLASSRASESPTGPVATLAFLDTIDDRSRAPVGQVLAADLHARAGEAALREHAVGGARRRGRDDHEVVGVVLDPDVGDVAAEPRRQLRHQWNQLSRARLRVRRGSPRTRRPSLRSDRGRGGRGSGAGRSRRGSARPPRAPRSRSR